MASYRKAASLNPSDAHDCPPARKLCTFFCDHLGARAITGHYRKRTYVRTMHRVNFLHYHSEGPAAQAWWAAVAESPHAAPGPVRKLIRTRQRSVIGGLVELQQALAWARAHPGWNDDDPPMILHDSVILPPAPARPEPLF